ncbi:MAG: 3-hydroxyacyl-CoA dehydrogenase family protein [Tepidisphaeraceae bacterium]
MDEQVIGVAGLGLLGRGIVTSFLSRGFRVVALEPGDAVRDDARRYIETGIGELVTRGGMPQSLLNEWQARYRVTTDVADLAPCAFVVESIFEDPDAKRALYDQLERIVGPAVPIASNTSALPISALQKGRVHPERFVGMHWAMPCHLTWFLEVIRGEQTNEATLEAAIALGKRAGKDPTLVQKDVEGFIVNRVAYAAYREALWLLENGVADVDTIDRSIRNARSVWGNLIGPFRWMDISGLPGYAAVMDRLFPALSCAQGTPKVFRELIDSGAKGISNGKGFYDYTPEEAERWRKLLIENVWRIREVNEDLLESGAE